MIDTIINTVFSEYGAFVGFLLVTDVILYRRTVELSNTITKIVTKNTEVMTQLVERLREHDDV